MTSFLEDDLKLNKELQGKVVASASSSLTMFAVKFDDGSGILLESIGMPDSVSVKHTLMPADQLPSIDEAVCKVDWSWIAASKIQSVRTTIGSFKFMFDPAEDLLIAAMVWDQKPFLSFKPYQPSK